MEYTPPSLKWVFPFLKALILISESLDTNSHRYEYDINFLRKIFTLYLII
jgi:hypothetical protein